MSFTGSGEVKSSLFTVASASVDLGFSIIPVFGNRDLSKAKVAAVDWKPFQTRRATHAQLYDWFERKRFDGLAIVTGRISNLVVLDFDNQSLADQFERRFPELAQTRKIRSAGRDLPHYYFRPPSGVSLQSRRLKGLDFQGEGRYVVAPPTTIDGKVYRIQRGGSPRQLTRYDLEQINGFLDEIANVEKMQLETVQPEFISVATHSMSQSEIAQSYHLRSMATGRNEALFSMALALRDRGYSQSQTLGALIPLHLQSALKGESALERQREAEATIQSTYSRSPRKIHFAIVGLPNTVREALLVRDQIAVCRVLDALMLYSAPTGALWTERQIVEALSAQVGRCTILQALKALASAGQRFFEAVNPFPTPHTPTNVALENSLGTINQCLMIGVTAPNKNRGRPAAHYRIPSVDQLCQWLGVKKTSADPVTVQDLRSSAHYRRALHREFIKRRPGTYHIKLLAKRLNITDRTCQRYNRVCGIRLQPTYERIPLVAGMLHSLSVAKANMFLQDNRGKRYPCLPEIGQRLLALGRLPMVFIQGFNHYTHPDGLYEPPALAQIAFQTLQKPVQAVSNVFISNERVSNPKTSQTTSQAQSSLRPTLIAPDVHTERQEQAAQKLYEQIKRMLGNVRDNAEQRALSLKSARRLVAQYGVELLEKAAILITTRNNIQNYAGFVVSFLRSETTSARLTMA